MSILLFIAEMYILFPHFLNNSCMHFVNPINNQEMGFFVYNIK